MPEKTVYLKAAATGVSEHEIPSLLIEAEYDPIKKGVVTRSIETGEVVGFTPNTEFKFKKRPYMY